MRNGARYQRGNRTVDAFADALAETGEITAAANRLGVSRDYAKSMFRRIRRELGWQAQ